jgi:ribosomal protein S18 acetylase RimI-like enzyme
MHRKQGLTQTELAEIEHLAQLCNTYDGLDLKLNWNTLRSRPQDATNDFLYYEDGLLVAFLGLYAFNSREAEVSGMVHPAYRRRGIFSALFDAAVEECRSRHLPQILLIVEHVSAAGQAFARTLPVTYDHSEYKMALEEARIPSRFDEQLQFREARAEDIPCLSQITALAFGMSEHEVDWYSQQVLENSARRYYVGILKNVCIGKIDVSLEGQAAFIYGFAVLPEYRGRGYGQQILARTIQELLTLGHEHILLEVATENRNALSLYQSCGFKETGSYDYYALPVSGYREE